MHEHEQEISEGAEVLLGDGWGVDSPAQAETLASGHPVEFLRYVVSHCIHAALKRNDRAWGALAHWILASPAETDKLRNAWNARRNNPSGTKREGEQPYRPWDGTTLPDGTSFGSPNLPARMQEWLDRMAAKRRAIDPKYLGMALELGTRIPEWFAGGAVPQGHLMPGTPEPVAWQAPTDPLDDQAAWLLTRLYIQIPRAVEVLKDGGVRKVASRPANWNDAQVALLAEVMGCDPFPPPTPRDEVERVVMDSELVAIMAHREPPAPEGEAPRLTFVKPREEVVVPIEPFRAAERAKKHEARKALESDEPPEMDGGWWNAVAASEPPPGR